MILGMLKPYRIVHISPFSFDVDVRPYGSYEEENIHDVLRSKCID